MHIDLKKVSIFVHGVPKIRFWPILSEWPRLKKTWSNMATDYIIFHTR